MDSGSLFMVWLVCMALLCCCIGVFVGAFAVSAVQGQRRVTEMGVQTDARAVSLQELTVEAIRARLLRRGHATGGAKAELVMRLWSSEAGWPLEV